MGIFCLCVVKRYSGTCTHIGPVTESIGAKVKRKEVKEPQKVLHRIDKWHNHSRGRKRMFIEMGPR